MEFEGANILVQMFNNIDMFLLVFVRVIGFILILPVLSGQNIPAYVKVAIAGSIALLTSINGTITMPVYEPTLFSFTFVIISEFFVGLILGFIVYIYFSIFYFVGQLVDYQIGFSMVSVYDPISQIQTPITGNLYYLVMTVFFLVTGSFHSFIYAVHRSYDVVGIGQGKILENDQLMTYMLNILKDYFVIGIKIAFPIIATIILVDVALGIIVKAVPQMNVFVVGMPIKLFIGLIAFLLIIPLMIDVYDYVIELVMKYSVNILKGLSP